MADNDNLNPVPRRVDVSLGTIGEHKLGRYIFLDSNCKLVGDSDADSAVSANRDRDQLRSLLNDQEIYTYLRVGNQEYDR